jgi:dTMP kinase
MNVNPGKFIAFEGIDGSGKSTQLARLAATLQDAGHDVVCTKEPTNGSWGQKIRRMAQSAERVSPEEELSWFIEDRREHMAQVVLPELAAGRIVLTDRCYLSSVAYQGARGLDPEKILADHEAAFPKPDLAILVAVRPERGLARVEARGGVAEPAFEEIEFLREVSRVFDGLECAYLTRVDGEGTVDEVHARVVALVRDRLDLLR